MTRAPKVSVVIPTRNRADVLVRAVRSVLAQSFGDLELIVVNDASTDHTLEVLGKFTDQRLQVLTREKNAGAAAARNAGILEAQGQYIAFLDDDDFWLVDKLDHQVAALEAAPPDVGLCLAGFISMLTNLTIYVGGEQALRGMDFRKGGGWGGPSYWLISTPAWLVRRELLDRVGLFDERFRSYDDWELALRLSKVCRFIQVDRPLWVQDWARIESGMVFNELRQADDLVLATQKHGHIWKDERRAEARHFYFIGKTYAFHKSPREGIPWLLKSLVRWPFRIRAWIVLLLALGGRAVIAAATTWSRGARSTLRKALYFWKPTTT
jgi:glycosyltransferase involved in cell wall biosynthesis